MFKIKHRRVIINKKFIKKYLGEQETVSKSLSRYIDNSIYASRTIDKRLYTCVVKVTIMEDLIIVEDNSGGIDPNINSEDVTRIGCDCSDNISGVGMKKSLFSLGSKMKIESNNSHYSRELILDINIDSEELEFQIENIEYNSSEVEGTKVLISDLDKKTKYEINKDGSLDNIMRKLGRVYNNFIQKGELQLLVNGKVVIGQSIEGEFIDIKSVINDYEIKLYKGTNNELGGVDFYVNGFLKYDRSRNKNEIKWNTLTQSKYRFGNCIAEINYYGDENKFQEEKEYVFSEMITFIKEKKQYFQSKTVTIQYEMEIDKVEALKLYYDENTAKGIGIKSFNNMYEDYLSNGLRPPHVLNISRYRHNQFM